jgi:hypothetical protein
MYYFEEQEESIFTRFPLEDNGLLIFYALSTGEYFSELRRAVIHITSG